MPSKLSASETGVIFFFFAIAVVLGCTAFCYVRRRCALMNTRKQVSASRQVSEVPMCISRKRTVFFFFFPYLNGGTLRCGCIQVCSRANYRWLRVVLTAFLNDEWLRFFVCLFISILSSLQLWFSSFSLPCELSRVLLARSSHYGVEVFYNAPDTTHKLL